MGGLWLEVENLEGQVPTPNRPDCYGDGLHQDRAESQHEPLKQDSDLLRMDWERGLEEVKDRSSGRSRAEKVEHSAWRERCGAVTSLWLA